MTVSIAIDYDDCYSLQIILGNIPGAAAPGVKIRQLMMNVARLGRPEANRTLVLEEAYICVFRTLCKLRRRIS